MSARAAPTILGIGAALPEQLITNAALAERLDTSDEWVQARTGIRQRYIAGPGESLTSISTEAAHRAMTARAKRGSPMPGMARRNCPDRKGGSVIPQI